MRVPVTGYSGSPFARSAPAERPLSLPHIRIRSLAAITVVALLSALLLAACEDEDPPESPGLAFNEPLMGGEPLTFESRGMPVAAELLTPEGEGPFPGVLFVSGSGATRRDGVSPPLDLRTDEVLLGLRDSGFAVLSFDDRGSGWTPVGGLDLAAAGYEVLLDDARAALAALRAHDDVDSEQIYLMGHSEGGQTVIVLASEAEPGAIDGIITLAAPARPIDEILIEQASLILGPDAPPAQRQAIEEQQRLIVEAIINDTLNEAGIPPSQLAALQLQVPWIREIRAYDVPALLAEIESPALLMQGSKDWQVSPARDGAVLEEVIAERTDGSRYVLLEDADHLFWLEPEASSQDRYFAPDREFHPDLLPAITGWLDEVGGESE